MKINRIALDNILCHKGIDINFNDMDPIVGVTGENGSGKTAIIEAVVACLYGDFPSRPGSIYDKISQGHEGDARIRVVFDMNGETFAAEKELKRTGKTTSAKASLYKYIEEEGDDVLIAGPKVTDFENAVVNLLGPRDVFMASVFSSQGNAGDICSAKPSERKAVFGQLLGLGKFDKISTAAKEKAKWIEGTVDANKEIVKGLRERANGATQAEEDLLWTLREQGEANVNLEAQRGKVEALEADAKAEAVALEVWRRDRDNIATLVRVDQFKVETLDRDLRTAYGRVEVLQGTPQEDCCKACPLVADALKARNRIPELKEALAGAVSQLNIDQTKLEEEKANGPKSQGTILQITKEKLTQREMEQAVLNLTTQVGMLRERIAGIEVANQEADRMETGIAGKEKDAEDYRAIEEAFGRSGIQPLLIEQARPELEDIAGELLGKATDGRMSVRFETQRELKSGDKSESLDIIITMDGNERKIEDFSGGEQKMIRTAVRLTLAIWQARRGGSRLRTIFIDEVADALDGENSDRILKLLGSLTGQFERIFIVSHDDNLLEEIPCKIHLTMGQGITKLP